ncbi:MAG: acetoacetyl-CoA reductase [Gammaproteobacteria bacterium]|nr:acetoacetyl-CoA reductase [Gammaproteobacteria bacterium]
MKGRTALITGGLGVIGTAISREFINLGAKVIVVDRGSKEKAQAWQTQQKEEGYEIACIYADVTNYDNCCDMAKNIEKNFNPIDIIVNGAGTIQDVSFRKMTPEQWNHVLHTDLDSLFNVTRQFINGMIERGYGRIINISSVNGEKGQFGQTNYASAKSGMYGFTKSLALEVAKYGITVNSISPGYVESKMVMSIAEDIQKQIIAQIPVGRLAKPEEIAWAIAFLASERSAFITGSNLAINGGIHMY